MDDDTQDDITTEEPTDIPTEPEKPQPVVVPIVSAFDHMRVRVRDMLELEAYTPAIQELYNILEQTTVEEGKRRKAEQEAEDTRRKEERMALKKAREAKRAAEAKKAKAVKKQRLPTEGAPEGENTHPNEVSGQSKYVNEARA
jgi:hypothetical protein